MKTLKSPQFWIGIAISVLCLWLALRKVQFQTFSDALQNANFVWIFAAVLIQFLAVVTRAMRWSTLLGKPGLFTKAFWSHSVGFLFTNVFPFRMGEPARIIVMSERSGIPVMEVTATAMIERVLDVAIVVLMLMLVLPFMQVPPLVISAAKTFSIIVLVALVALWVVVRFRDWSNRLIEKVLGRFKFLPRETLMARWNELVDGLELLTHWKTGANAVLWTVLSWAASAGIYYCALKAFVPESGWIEAVFMVVSIALAITVPSSPGFIGVYQYVGQQALVLPFGAKYDMGSALAITLAAYLVYYVITTLLGLVGLYQAGQSFSHLWQMVSAKREKKETEKAE
jgi:uncharacterized protein (TIRG00374 family)